MRRNRQSLRQLMGIVALLWLSQAALAEETFIGRFSHGDMQGWEEKSFVGNTRYGLVENDKQRVLQAETRASASGLFREMEIDLNKTPYLNWSWKVGNVYRGNDERSKQGDDYPARIYVVVSGGLFFWKTRAINYVWSSNQAIGTTWDNAYTGNAKMIALRSGETQNGQWLTEKRNVREDFKRLFGAEIHTIHAVAIMSDSDNARQNATAWYGDLFFSAE